MTEEVFRGVSAVDDDQLVIVYNSLTEMYGFFFRPGNGPDKGCCQELMVLETDTIMEMVNALNHHIIMEGLRKATTMKEADE